MKVDVKLLLHCIFSVTGLSNAGIKRIKYGFRQLYTLDLTD